MQETMMELMSKSDQRIKSLKSTVSNLVTLMSQRAHGTMPSHTKANPKEELNVLTTRNKRPIAKLKKKDKVALPPQKKILTKEKPKTEKKKKNVEGLCSNLF